MSKGSFADTSFDWESLQGACLANLNNLPDVEPFTQALADIQLEVRELKILQEDLDAKRQGTTQQLYDAVARGEEAARRLRGFIKARLGTKSEYLVQFGIAPIRSLKGRRKSPVSPPPPPPAELTAAEE